MDDGIKFKGVIEAECYGPDGKLKWRSRSNNRVVDEGINYIFGNDIEAASLFVGLKDTGTPLAAWTLSSGLTEITPYSGNRLAFTENASGTDEGISNSGSPASFSINATDTVFGAFLATVNTGTAGTLIAAGDFSGGSQAVSDGDTLNVTYTITGSSS